jgi:hypothetical protein
MKRNSLRAWLRREPAPAKVMVRLEDGDEKEIHIPGDLRNRWKTVEASINASGAVAVQLLDKKGTLLRGQDVEHEPDEDESPEAQAAATDTRKFREMADFARAVMHEQNTSFEKGVAAAAQSQDSLTSLVDSMASHFATALTNIHNIVANMAIMQQQHAEQTAKLTQKIAELSVEGNGASALDKLAENVLPAMLAAAATKQNGQPKKEGK